MPIERSTALLIQQEKQRKCRVVFAVNAPYIAHLKAEMGRMAMTTREWFIIIVNADDRVGQLLIGFLPSGLDRQEVPGRGQMSFARAIAKKESFQDMIATLNKEAAAKLQTISGMAVVIMNEEVIEVFEG
jgi:hypothetical protein